MELQWAKNGKKIRVLKSKYVQKFKALKFRGFKNLKLHNLSALKNFKLSKVLGAYFNCVEKLEALKNLTCLILGKLKNDID